MTGKTIMIVDDDRGFAQSLACMLASADYRSCVSHDPAGALLHARNKRIDCALIDFNLGATLGTALIARLCDPEELLAAIETAIARERDRVQLSTGIADARRLLLQLTQREREVVDAIVGGLSSKQIAGALSVSQRTIEAHRANVLQKLGISNTASLVRLAVLAGLGSPQAA
jgi:FixJ family two-component response regulator